MSVNYIPPPQQAYTPEPDVPAGGLVGLRPNPITGEMVISGGSAATQQEVINHYRQQGVTAVVSNYGGARGGDGAGRGSTVDPDAEERANVRRERSMNAIETMRGIMTQYGLGSLMDKITSYVTQGYTDPDAIVALIRTTPEYAARFPAMKELARQNRGISEAEYISYETEAQGYERMYGLPSGMLTNSETISNLLTKAVSGRELEERVTMAAAGAFQTSPEVKKQFKDFYGIDSGGLTAYFLDPDKATPLLTKQYASAQIGAEAAMQGVDVGMSLAEQLNIAGVTRDEARIGFGAVAGEAGLSVGAGDVVSQGDLIKGNLLGDQAAKANKERAIGGKLGKFQGGGEFLQTQQGAVGLGSASSK